jgi:RNA polymerase primary sigma factor
MTKAAEKLEAEIERQPKANEISHQLGMSSNEILNAMMYSRRHSSLDTPFQNGEDNSLMNVLEDPHEDSPDDVLMRESMKEDVKLSLETLTDRERTVIEMYYGINGGRALTLNEIGEAFHLTRERVRQIKAKAIQRLGHKSRSKLLRKYLG